MDRRARKLPGEYRRKVADVDQAHHGTTAGQVGQPRTITGFQTHTTPVLLSAGDRAEIATETHESLSPVLEGVCIVRKKAEEGAAAAGGSS